jgi:3-oxoacyl-[acyl-carrier protein] reductase
MLTVMIIQPALRSELLAGRTAIVTGGARGIGGATSITLAANGAHVVVADVDAAKAAETVTVLNDEFGDGTAVDFVEDLIAPGACDRLVSHATDTFGGLDIVVNNAGYALDGGIHALSDADFQAMLDIHLIVPFRIARACAPVFRDLAAQDDATGAGHHRKTVIVSSGAGTRGLAGAANYASGKAGVLGLTRSMALEWGKYRVNVNAIAFGVIQTRFGQPQNDENVIRTGGRTIHVGMQAKQAHRRGIDPTRIISEEQLYRPRTLPQITLGRAGTIREAADAIFFLASPLSDYITGQVLEVNGGVR